ncbi:MAG TPA: serine/threonine-protein kinase [Polyangium sp.]|nr:serine/threonine-protein kinase [Polyangium sp.]
MKPFENECMALDDSIALPFDTLSPGTEILGKYIVERMLGAGGMGFVVAARHRGLGRLDAIKFLLPQTATDPETLMRFEREAQATAKLSSPHVTRIYDAGFTDAGEPYIVMEYLEGHDLKSVLRRGPLPVDVAIEYLLQVCQALSEAHDSGIVHRDLKPANLFLTFPKNAQPCVKVLDFGIAKMTISGEDSEITREGSTNGLLGTIHYMSPEHLKGAKDVDARTDIWAMGVIAYEFLTGQKPFHGATRLVLMAKILDRDEHPEPPSTHRPEVPRAIERVIGRCLAKDRDARYQTVQEFETALREAAGILPAPSPRAPMSSIPQSIPLTKPSGKAEATQPSVGVVSKAPRAQRRKAKMLFFVVSPAIIGLPLLMFIVSRESSILSMQMPVDPAPPITSATVEIIPMDAALGDAEHDETDTMRPIEPKTTNYGPTIENSKVAPAPPKAAPIVSSTPPKEKSVNTKRGTISPRW